MTQENPYRIFVTHGWQQDEDYLRVFEYLEEATRFFYRNAANPGVARPANADSERELLRSQISHCEIVIALAGQYPKAATTVDFQLMFAQSIKRPIIALRCFGSQQPLPQSVTGAAAEILDWDSRALIVAIKRHARGEGGAAWDVVEFKLE